MNACSNTCTHTYTHTHTNTHVCTHADKIANTKIHAEIHASIHTNTFRHAHTFVQVNKDLQTYIYSHWHKYTGITTVKNTLTTVPLWKLDFTSRDVKTNIPTHTFADTTFYFDTYYTKSVSCLYM